MTIDNRSRAAVLVAAAVLFCADAALSQRGRGRRGRPSPQRQAQQPEEAAPEKEPEVEQWTAIRGGDVHVGDGTILRRATVLIGDDEIHGVGYDELEIPEDAEIVDASGKVVAPGFCIVNASGFGTPRSGNSVRDGLNPFDPTIKMGLAAGITSFLWTSGGGSDKPGGNSALVKLHYGDLESMAAKPDPVVSMRVPLNVQQMHAFRELVDKAREHLQKVREAEEDDEAKTPKPPRGTEEVVAVMQGRKKLWINGPRVRRGFMGSSGRGFDVTSLRQALEVARLLDVGVVLNDPVEGWVIPDEIAATGSMAVVAPRSRVRPDPAAEETTGSNLAQAAILAEAGVPVAVTVPSGGYGGPSVGTGGIMGQDLNTPHVDAAYAVRGGLDNRAALRTLTLDAARIVGAADRVGSLEPGKDADILILDGAPLHYKTFVETAFVDGEVVYVKDQEPYYRHIKR